MSATLKHSLLGELKGNAEEGIAQFLGLKYATLRNRLAPAEIVESYGTGAVDATKYGPPPVSPIGAINNEFGFLQRSLPLPEVPVHSDLDGLSLNITVPVGQNGEVPSNASLPVYVFVHGGGFAVGSSWYPHYSPVPIVKLSAELGKPIIGVTINYRLGLPGFLTSEELRKAGYQPNNGLHDQQTAMKWIKKNIGGFGGNPDEITAVGESAGGLSVTMFLCSQEPLMKRVLSTGGATLLFKPLPIEVAEQNYKAVVEALGLADKSPEERVQGLLSAAQDDLWQKIPPSAPMLPVIDQNTVPGLPTFQNVSAQGDDPSFSMPGKKWCDAVMVGESKLDANIIAYMGLDARNPGIASKFIDSVNKTFSSQPDFAAQLLSAYNISSTSSDQDAMLSILLFASETCFYAPARAMAAGWPSSSKFFLYHFNEGIPWEGRFQGEAGHILDVAYLFQNYNAHLDEKQKKVARAYAEDFIAFVNGEDPWTPAKPDRFSARVYGPSSEGITTKFTEDGNPKDIGRDERVLKLGESIGYDNLITAFENFFRGQ